MIVQEILLNPATSNYNPPMSQENIMHHPLYEPLSKLYWPTQIDELLTQEMPSLGSDDQAFIEMVLETRTQDLLECRHDPYTAAVYQKFLIDTISSKNIEDLENILKRLTDRKKEAIDENTLKELQHRMIHDAKKLAPDIARGRKTVARYAHKYPLPIGAAYFMYGSLQYGDAHNLDADVVIGVPNGTDYWKIRPTIKESARLFILSLSASWEHISRIPNSPPQVSVLSVGDISPFPRIIIGAGGELADYLATDASSILTGLPVFEEDEPASADLRHEFRQAIDTDWLLTILVNDEIRACLEIRQERSVQLYTHTI